MTTRKSPRSGNRSLVFCLELTTGTSSDAVPPTVARRMKMVSIFCDGLVEGQPEQIGRVRTWGQVRENVSLPSRGWQEDGGGLGRLIPIDRTIYQRTMVSPAMPSKSRSFVRRGMSC